MMKGLKVITMRGETYVFTARPGTAEVESSDVGTSEFPVIRIFRGKTVLGLFPARNVEAILPIGELDGEVAP